METCQINDSVGINLLENQPLGVYYLDTLSLGMSTVKFDSLPTSLDNRLLVGRAVDEDLGELKSTAYFQINMDSIEVTVPKIGDIEYKSLALECNFDKYWYYDTTADFTLSIYTVLDDITDQKDGYLYNVDSFPYTSDPPGDTTKIGEMVFKPRPYGGEIEIPLSDTLGLRLIGFLRNTARPATFDLRKIIKGFALVAGPDNKCFIGLSNKTRLKLTYLNSGVEQYLQFWATNNIIFNHITSNRENTNLKNLVSQRQSLSSRETNRNTFIEGGAGLGTRISFPTLSDLGLFSKQVVVTEAKLDIYPRRKSYDKFTGLAPQLTIYTVDNFNRVQSQLQASGVLYIDDEFKQDTYYEVNVTQFIQQQLHTPPYLQESLLLIFSQSNFNSAVNRLILEDKTVRNSTKIKIKIASLNE